MTASFETVGGLVRRAAVGRHAPEGGHLGPGMVLPRIPRQRSSTHRLLTSSSGTSRPPLERQSRTPPQRDCPGARRGRRAHLHAALADRQDDAACRPRPQPTRTAAGRLPPRLDVAEPAGRAESPASPDEEYAGWLGRHWRAQPSGLVSTRLRAPGERGAVCWANDGACCAAAATIRLRAASTRSAPNTFPSPHRDRSSGWQARPGTSSPRSRETPSASSPPTRRQSR